jgi:hypothetical protein
MPKGNKEGGGLKSSPVYKMKGSPMQRNFGISPVKDNGNKGVFDTKNQKQTLKEYKSQQNDFLNKADLTANQDTVSQSNINYFKKTPFGPNGNVSKMVVRDAKNKQVNKNIDLSKKPNAGSRSSERIQKNRYATSEHGSKKNLNKKIKNLSSDITSKDSFTSFSSTTPKTKTTNKGKIKQGYAPISFPLGRKI